MGITHLPEPATPSGSDQGRQDHGDNARTAAAIVRQVGAERVCARVLPDTRPLRPPPVSKRPLRGCNNRSRSRRPTCNPATLAGVRAAAVGTTKRWLTLQRRLSTCVKCALQVCRGNRRSSSSIIAVARRPIRSSCCVRRLNDRSSLPRLRPTSRRHR